MLLISIVYIEREFDFCLKRETATRIILSTVQETEIRERIGDGD